MNRSMGRPALELEEMPEVPSADFIHGATALAPAEGHEVTLRFRITANEPEALEALRHARRSVLREEGTLGLDPEEPSLEDAVFSPVEVVWSVRESQRDWSRRKVRDLADRAQRALTALSASPPGPRP